MNARIVCVGNLVHDEVFHVESYHWPLSLTCVGPVAHSDRGDGFWSGDEVSPSLAGGVDDLLVGVEDAVGEPVGAQVLPDVLDRVEFGGARGQQDQGDVLRYHETAARVPAGAVEQKDGVSAPGDAAADLLEMELHGFGVGVRQGERRAFALGRADRAEEIGALVALVGRLARPRPASRPLPHQPVLLADASFILEPDLDRLRASDGAEMCAQGLGEVFLNASMVRASCPGWRGRELTWEKPSLLSSLPMVRSWYSTPKRSATTR